MKYLLLLLNIPNKQIEFMAQINMHKKQQFFIV